MKPDIPVIFTTFANNYESKTDYLRNLSKEQTRIREVLTPAINEGLCELVQRANVTLKQIVDVFQDKYYRNRISIFHYAGHANSYQLLVETLEKGVFKVNSKGLTKIFSQEKSLKLVFLNGCSTELQARDLIKSKIPIVIGTSSIINDYVATQLSVRFYSALAQGIDIERAWMDAESMILAENESGDFRNLYLQDKYEKEEFPWNLYLSRGASSILKWNLPSESNNPLFGIPDIPAKYYQSKYLPKKPFVHLQYYKREFAGIFFGRGREIRSLYNQIKGPDPVILYYGESGVGKSSLLSAGLFPRLENDFIVKYLRRGEEKELLGTLSAAINQIFEEKGCIDSGKNLLQILDEIEVLSDRPYVFILDQVEEAITKPLNSDNSISGFDELDNLAKAIDQLCNQKDRKSRFIFSYRKEYHPDIEQYFIRYNIPFSELFLTPLSRKGILEVIEGITKNEKLYIKYKLALESGNDGSLVDIIADDLLEDKKSAIAPVLQILLSKLWDKAKENNRETNEVKFKIIDYQELKKGGILLKDFLNQQLGKLSIFNREVVESGLAIDILYYHTTPLVTAATRTIQELESDYSHRKDVLEGFLEKCVEFYLLSKPNENSFKLSHDTLSPLIKERFEYSNKPGQQARRIMFDKVKNDLPVSSKELMIILLGNKGRSFLSVQDQKLLNESVKKHLGLATKDIIQNGKIDEAIRILSDYLESINKNLYEEIAVIEVAYKSLLNEYRAGKYTTKQFGSKRNFIVSKIIDICERVDKGIKDDLLNTFENILNSGDFKLALSIFSEFYKERDSEIYNRVILLLNKHKELIENDRKGILSFEGFYLEISQVWHSLLEIYSETIQDKLELIPHVKSGEKIDFKELYELVQKDQLGKVIFKLINVIPFRDKENFISLRVFSLKLELINKRKLLLVFNDKNSSEYDVYLNQISHSLITIISTLESTKIESVSTEPIKENGNEKLFVRLVKKIQNLISLLSKIYRAKEINENELFIRKRQKVLNSIENSNINQALFTLLELSENSNYKDRILLLFAQNKRLENSKFNSSLSFEEYDRGKLRLSHSILEILKEIENTTRLMKH